MSGSSDAHVRLAPDHASSHNNLATLLMGEVVIKHCVTDVIDHCRKQSYIIEKQ